jgi:hypothetical protein
MKEDPYRFIPSLKKEWVQSEEKCIVLNLSQTSQHPEAKIRCAVELKQSTQLKQRKQVRRAGYTSRKVSPPQQIGISPMMMN